MCVFGGEEGRVRGTVTGVGSISRGLLQLERASAASTTAQHGSAAGGPWQSLPTDPQTPGRVPGTPASMSPVSSTDNDTWPRDYMKQQRYQGLSRVIKSY